MAERAFTIVGASRPLNGTELKVGDTAPKVTVVSNSMEEVDPIAAATGKVRIVLSVPSLDTGICDREARTFNERAAQVPGAEVIVVSMDLPFAQKRWCGAAGVERVTTYSDYRYASLGEAFGVLVPSVRLLARAAFVVDANDKLTYVEYLPAAANEPNYDAVLAAAAGK